MTRLKLAVLFTFAVSSTRVFAQIGAPPATRPPTSTLQSGGGPGEAADALAQAPYGKPQKLEYRIILTGYKDNYIISGFSKATEVKFQFSLKFDLWPNRSRHSVFFGYTQKSLWNLYDSSSPFVDSNYNPEFFYGYFKRYGDVVWVPGQVTFFVESFRAGVEHESNGRDGLDSRGWNRVYGYVNTGAYFGSDYYATFALKGWLPPFLVDTYNPDIVSYRGYGEGTLVVGYDPVAPKWWGGGHLGANYYHGASNNWSHQGIEAFFQWRPAYDDRVWFWRFTPFFYAQFFHGYAEYLLAYNQRDTAFRIGVSIEDRVHWVDRAR
jgi:outer membrane phospholipase A